MPSSSAYREMVSGIKKLRRTYLNYSPRPIGDYTERQISCAAAYTIFCHAEFEHYLEIRTTEVVDYAEKNWKKFRATRALVYLCTFHEGRKSITAIPQKNIWDMPVYESLSQHRKVIDLNHGIKEENICKMFAPLGLDLLKIDPILVGDLTAFGRLRGNHAHQSHRIHIGTVVDPFDRQKKAHAIAQLLQNFDHDVTSCMSG